MKKLFLSMIVFGIVFIAMGQKTIISDANAEQRVLSGSFSAIKISNGIDLYLSQYDNETVAVSASEQQYKDGIKTVIANNTLLIYYNNEKKWVNNKKLKVYVAFKDLQKIEASGSSDIYVAGTVEVNNLVLDLSGSSDFKGDVKVSALTLNLSGSSDVKISGSANDVAIQSSGASDVNGYELIAEKCTAKASGASDI